MRVIHARKQYVKGKPADRPKFRIPYSFSLVSFVSFVSLALLYDFFALFSHRDNCIAVLTLMERQTNMADNSNTTSANTNNHVPAPDATTLFGDKPNAEPVKATKPSKPSKPSKPAKATKPKASGATLTDDQVKQLLNAAFAKGQEAGRAESKSAKPAKATKGSKKKAAKKASKEDRRAQARERGQAALSAAVEASGKPEDDVKAAFKEAHAFAAKDQSKYKARYNAKLKKLIGVTRYAA